MIMAAAEFKAKCLALLDQVNETGEVLIITKRGRPVAKLGPVDDQLPKSLIGSVVRQRDLVSPTGEPWDAES